MRHWCSYAWHGKGYLEIFGLFVSVKEVKQRSNVTKLDAIHGDCHTTVCTSGHQPEQRMQWSFCDVTALFDLFLESNKHENLLRLKHCIERQKIVISSALRQGKNDNDTYIQLRQVQWPWEIQVWRLSWLCRYAPSIMYVNQHNHYHDYM